MMGKKVLIIDYGLGNVYSIQQACMHVGVKPILSSEPSEIKSADALILPGVGAFGNAMDTLTLLGLKNEIIDFAKSGKPLMGVCLGMQLLFDVSEEFGEHEGLGLIKGKIRRFPVLYRDVTLRIPHIGWNKIFKASNPWENTPLANLENETYMYFVHSYYAETESTNVLTTTVYEDFDYCSGVVKDNIFGFQFHPEKSGEQGLKIYKKFLSL
jgi:imidazole glycerol-phosphate synthase subunit HisH